MTLRPRASTQSNQNLNQNDQGGQVGQLEKPYICCSGNNFQINS